MRVNFRGFYIGMAEQFLHDADISSGFQQMRGKGMAQGAAKHGSTFSEVLWNVD